jgi:hypothetical protein
VNVRLAVLLVALAALPAGRAAAQRPPERGLYLTVFRSPSTGLEYRAGRLGVHAGWYPTILKADGQDEGENTNFVRLGGAVYLRPSGLSPYLSPAVLVSLDDDWKTSFLAEAGLRIPVAGRFSFRGGVGVLTDFAGEVRVNPTVGLDVRLGRK